MGGNGQWGNKKCSTLYSREYYLQEKCVKQMATIQNIIGIFSTQSSCCRTR